MGSISYGIYMYHLIVITGLLFCIQKIHANIPGYLLVILINLISVIATLLVAHFSMKYFESKFLQIKNRTNLK